MNALTIAGNLGTEPETRTTGSGKMVCTLNVGVTTREKRGDEWGDHTEWFRVVCWGSTAEACARHLRKGAPVLVQGRLRTEKWQDRDGQDRYTVKVYASDVVFLGQAPGRTERTQDPGSTEGNQGGTGHAEDPGYGGGAGGGGHADDDIPF